MECCDDGRKDRPVPPEHKFDYINLSDFKSHSCFKIMAYMGIYFGTIISVSCYIADMYTVITLLALGTWSNTIQQNTEIINFSIARIIFAVCIFLSFIILVYDWFRAIRVIRRNGVAESYMNVISVRWSCIWGGRGKGDTGWKRFLVFARLTDSRGWVDYIALFTYFALKGWVRIIFAEGPRVVINALTLISVTKLKDGIENKTAAVSILQQFWTSVQTLYAKDKFSVVTLATMAFTTIFWIIAVLRLLLASILYITFLWHHMGGVSLWRYCKERLDTRMGEIVMKKHEKALAKDKQRFGNLQPTVPVLNDIQLEPEKKQRAFMSEDEFANSTTNLMPPNRNMSSTPALSTLSIPSTLTPAPLPANMQREPRVPSVADQYDGVERIRPPPPVRGGTDQSFSSTEALLEYRQQKEYSPLERQPQNNYNTPYSNSGKQEYQMQQLSPSQQQPRNGGAGGYMPQGRFPINSRPLVPPQQSASPTPSTVMDMPQDNPFPTFPADKDGAGGRGNGSPERKPPARAGTAPPSREGYGAPPQHDQHVMPPPLRTGTAPLPQSRGEGGYGGYQNQQPPPPSRTGTAPPQQMMPPARTGTAPPPQSRGGYGMPPPPSRSGTAPPPPSGGYGGYGQQSNGWGAQLPRAGTAPPPQQSRGYGNDGYGQDAGYGGYGNNQGYGQASRNQGYNNNGRPPPARNYGGGYGQPPSLGGYGGGGGGMV